MRALITSFNTKLGVNPIVDRLFDPLEPDFTRAKGVEDCDVVFLSFIAPEQDFVPDMPALERLTARRVPCIVFDHSETFAPNYLFGLDRMPKQFSYWILHDVASRHLDVKGYFKRELLAGFDLPQIVTGFPVYPLDWTIKTSTVPKTDTEWEFQKRPIDIFYSWGYSSEFRPRIFGELMRQAGLFCSHFALTEHDIERALAEGRERIFALLFTPHYRRINIKKILEWQQKSKISISMFGQGKKCFRCAESSYNCVMAQQEPESLIWSYPWVPNENCIRLGNHEIVSVDWLHHCLRVEQGALYPMYIKGMENNRNYFNDHYARDYVLPRIKEALK